MNDKDNNKLFFELSKEYLGKLITDAQNESKVLNKKGAVFLVLQIGALVSESLGLFESNTNLSYPQLKQKIENIEATIKSRQNELKNLPFLLTETTQKKELYNTLLSQIEESVTQRDKERWATYAAKLIDIKTDNGVDVEYIKKMLGDNITRLSYDTERGIATRKEALIREIKLLNEELYETGKAKGEAEKQVLEIKANEVISKMPEYTDRLEKIKTTLDSFLNPIEDLKRIINTGNNQAVQDNNAINLPENVLDSLGNVTDALERVASGLQGNQTVTSSETNTLKANNTSPGVIDNKTTEQSMSSESSDVKNNGQEGLRSNGKSSTQSTKDWSNSMKNIAAQTAQSLQSTMSSFFFDAVTGKLKSLSDYANNFLNSILQALSNEMATMFVKSIMNSLHFAAGGSVTEGSTCIVGEQGPEIFIPSYSGTIIPNQKFNNSTTGGLGREVMVNVINKTSQPVDAKQKFRFDGQKYIIDVQLDAFNLNIG